MVVDIYRTLTNIANKIMSDREKYLALEKLESGSVEVGDETVSIPQNQVAAIKVKLALARTKVTNLANAVGAEIEQK